MDILGYLRDRLSGFTVEGATVLLRHLGQYQFDKITVLTHKGYRNMPAFELVGHFNGSVPVDRLKPVYFWGGPMRARQYKGDFLTFLVDRAMYTACEKGWAQVNATINYCDGVTNVVT